MMMSTDQLIHLIKTALNSENNNDRSLAESQIIQYRDANPSQFFINCVGIIHSNKHDSYIRQLAGTVASRLLNMKNPNNMNYYWDQINPQEKETIKQWTLETLICPIPEIMKSAATIIAVIASIQLPREQWENIVDLMAENCINSELKIRAASITTLGYICEQIKNANMRINNRLSQQILGSIIMKTGQNQQELVKTALKALEDSLSFLESLMSQSIYRDEVFKVITNNFKNQFYEDMTYHALFEFVKVASPYLSQYSQILIDLSEAHLQRRDHNTVLNLELWQIIGQEYAEKQTRMKERIEDIPQQQNFMQMVSDLLLPKIMKCLLIMNKAEQEEAEEMKISAARTLETFAKVCNKNVVDSIVSASAAVINSEDPYQQQATVILFATICEYSDREYIRGVFSNAFQHLFNLLESRNKIVVKNSLMGFGRLAESFPQVFVANPNIQKVVNTIYDFVVVDVPEIRLTATLILCNMSQGLKEHPQPICEDPNILLTRIVKLWSQKMQVLHVEQTEINEKLTTIIMNIVMSTNKRDIIVQLIDFTIEEYYKVNNKNIQNNWMLTEQVLSVLHTSILAHKNAVPNNQLLGRICDLINYHLKKHGVEAQGLNLLGSLATTFNKSFEMRGQSYWQHIEMGLNMVDDIITFKAALACVGDFSRMLESSFLNYATQVMEKLLGYLKLDLDRQVKLAIISCIGDLLLSLQHYGQKFLESIISICDICFMAVYELTGSQRDVDYVEQLKSNLMEMYSCVVFAVNSSKPSTILLDHFGNLATFVVRTCDKNVHPTVDYLKNCLYLLHDSAAFYWSANNYREKIRNVVDSNEVKQLVKLIQRFSDRHDVKELLDFIHNKQHFL